MDRKDFYGILEKLHTKEVTHRLVKGTVGIAGLGGLGSNVAVMLARAGIGRLIIADFDRVETGNLNRQFYFTEQIGLEKTEALKDILGRVNPFVEITAFNTKITDSNIKRIFGRCDIIVEAFDKPEYKVMVVESVLEKFPEKYVVAASGLAGYGKCNEMKVEKIGHLYLCGDQVSEVKPGVPLMSPRVTIAAAMEANCVVEIFMEELSG
ncbi:MAG: sulfur carrier protein ThiS adenylyltransferase ThiF [Spirochaetales bacterium]|nr:sulfur carrier protein ThiS adenylyltransferase ThiF [Spirochaetales bacterium]